MRLDKLVCKSTQLSKGEAQQAIAAGKVLVNGQVQCNPAAQVHENNEAVFAGKRLKPRPFRYLLMNKTANTICSNIDEHYPSLFNELNLDNVSELHVAGRLDADTTGLVLITDDGRWSYNIIRPEKHCTKLYRVGLSKPLANNVKARFKEGIQLQGESKLTKPAELEIVQPQEVLLTLTEGKYHQVKRMFAAVGNKVVSLHREKIGVIVLDVEPGQWRYLTEQEVASF